MAKRIRMGAKELRQGLMDVAAKVEWDNQRLVITLWGRERFAIISLADLKRLENLDRRARA